MELKDAIHRRRSCRDYTAEPVDDTVLRALIDAAIQAPSAVNTQSWSFTVIRDAGLLIRISDRAKAHVLAAPPAAIPARRLEQLLTDASFDIFHHAPALILISSATGGDWAVENCCLAAENLMLAACERGLGTCFIGFAQAFLGTADGRAMIGLPPGHLPVAPIIVGHPRAPAPPVPRHEPEIRWLGP